MTEASEIQTILRQFQWARIEKDGSFNLELALAMRYLLGSGPNFGWWATEEPDAGLTPEISCDSNRLSSSHFQLGKYITL